MKIKKYVVYPGFVRSRSDGDRHYVTSDMLMRLYKVRRAECMIILPPDREKDYKLLVEKAERMGLIPLYPDNNLMREGAAT